MNFADREACLQWFESDKVNDQGLLVELVLSAWQAALEWRDSQVGEPFAYFCKWEDWSQYHDKLDPLPDDWDDAPESIVPLYLTPPNAQINEQMREALEWYQQQARLCRLIHSEGDAGRNALANDGGERAKTALAATPK